MRRSCSLLSSFSNRFYDLRRLFNPVCGSLKYCECGAVDRGCDSFAALISQPVQQVRKCFFDLR